MAETLVPPWVRRRLVRPAGPLVTFSVGWQPADVVRLEAERPPHAFQVQRERVRPLVRATARLIATETVGIVMDAGGFDVADHELWG